MDSPIIATLPKGHRMDHQLGVVYDAPPEQCDDLQQIAGLRLRESLLLNQLGVYRFGQIALWRHREISNFAGELQLPVSRIVDDNWVGQARTLCVPAEPAGLIALPASLLRTVAVLAAALVIGMLSVSLMTPRRNAPVTGLLAADITTIRVPSASRLLSVSVAPGDEVFTGQTLLTLEKLEHLKRIADQEAIVTDLDRELRRAEAQAAIELEWRKHELDQQLAAVAQQLTTLDQPDTRPAPKLRWSRISASRAVAPEPRGRHIGGLVFFAAGGGPVPVDSAGFSGIPEGGSSVEPHVAGASVVPSIRTAEADHPGRLLDSPLDEAREMQRAALLAEQDRLKSVRDGLAATIAQAIGVSSLKDRLIEARNHLTAMNSASREVVVTAPEYGVVGDVRFMKGDTMQEGEILLRILHSDRRYVVVNLPTRRVTEMKSGQEVVLRFPGANEFHGRVVAIPVLAAADARQRETVATVRIEPTGRHWPNVPIGTQVDVLTVR